MEVQQQQLMQDLTAVIQGQLSTLQVDKSVAELDVGRDENTVTSVQMHALSAALQPKLSSVISELPSYEKEGLGRTHLIEHNIDVADAEPVKQRHLPVSPAKEKLMFAEIENMLALDVIEESKRPWSSNCVLVQKGEKNRLCLDSRELNKLTLKDAYPLPHVDGILSRLPLARFITGLDIKHAFCKSRLIKSLDYAAQSRPGKVINEFPVPTTVKQLRRFLGLAGWYRREHQQRPPTSAIGRSA
ncbi:uncharacterized protein LOC135440152 [Drosophila montana]|uniref:uncharacterized protein LOC135440152 n=1 Tax=Drosophila montana TaxID=40370 RepID=UPI00313EE0A2